MTHTPIRVDVGAISVRRDDTGQLLVSSAHGDGSAIGLGSAVLTLPALRQALAQLEALARETDYPPTG